METFEQYRKYLFAIAYRMLGSVREAEDIVQESYLRWQQVDAASIESTKAYLSAIVTRLCLDTLKSARVQREQYIGPWLPEPLLTGDEMTGEPGKDSEASESISIAFLVLLEKLTASERAVFLLREIFDYGYDEIARIIYKEETACRQLFSRARKHLIEHRPRFVASSKTHEAIVLQFLSSCQTGDLQGLERLLAQDVVALCDGGGKASAATRPLFGWERVAKFWIGSFKKQVTEDLRIELTHINGEKGLIARVNGKAISTMIFDIRDGQIQYIWAIRNPDKLQHL